MLDDFDGLGVANHFALLFDNLVDMDRTVEVVNTVEMVKVVEGSISAPVVERDRISARGWRAAV